VKNAARPVRAAFFFAGLRNRQYAADFSEVFSAGSCGIGAFQALGEPHLDKALARDAETVGNLVEGFHHPFGKIHVHFCRREVKTVRLAGLAYFSAAQVEMLTDVFAAIKLGVEFGGCN